MASHEPGAPSWRTRLCLHSGNRACYALGGAATNARGLFALRSSAAEPAQAGGWEDNLRFAWEWLRDPIGTAAVAPSGRALASLITREIDQSTGKVLELGPGTGIFTDRLVARGVDQCDLTLVEQNSTFVRLLKQRYLRATVLDIDAAALGLVGQLHRGPFGAAICGLGLRNMPVVQIEAIVLSAFAHMLPGAAFYLFTYGRRCSVPREVLERLGLIAEHAGVTLMNLPPASVYRIRRLRDLS